MHQMIARKHRHRARRGTTVVEFAITAPLFFLLLFAALEFSRVNMIRNTIETATYEGTRRGIVPGAAASDVQTAALDTLAAAQVRDATVTVTPPAITPDTPQVTVTVSVELQDNFWVAPFFFRDGTLSSSLTLQRERIASVSVP